jgi:hypothetical protein
VFDFLKKAGAGGAGAGGEEGQCHRAGDRLGQFGPGGLEPARCGVAGAGGFQGNPVGFRAVRLIAEAAAALPVIAADAERRFEAIRCWR